MSQLRRLHFTQNKSSKRRKIEYKQIIVFTSIILFFKKR